jgi:RNA polymerase sigma-70 factor (sigma-E family)
VDGREADFHAFVDANLAGLGRLAYLLCGDREAADDLTADALLVAWQRWDRVQAADSPIAYVRGVLTKLAASRIRRLRLERSRLVLMRADARSPVADAPDVPGVVDVRVALRALPAGQRACLVLRHGLGLSEAETAATLGISVGTVKSQTSKAAAQMRQRLSADYLLDASGEGSGA